MLFHFGVGGFGVLASNPFTRHVAGELVEVQRYPETLLAAHRPVSLDLPIEGFFGGHYTPDVNSRETLGPAAQGFTPTFAAAGDLPNRLETIALPGILSSLHFRASHKSRSLVAIRT